MDVILSSLKDPSVKAFAECNHTNTYIIIYATIIVHNTAGVVSGCYTWLSLSLTNIWFHIQSEGD